MRNLAAGAIAMAMACACSSTTPTLRLRRVILYQNGIGYFERTGVVGTNRIELGLARHEVNDVLKTLTVIDRSGSSVATVDVPSPTSNDKRAIVGVRLAGGSAHDIQVSYAVPVPSWKPAYRLVLDDNSALLQGWAVVDNGSQEDWSDVTLTLATGAPMSYALDLATPLYIDRPDATGKLVPPVVLGPISGEKVGASAGDRDGDRIPNDNDLCPDQPEDRDGFEDEDGCPDPDNDKDRIADSSDKCPNEPETYNGIEDDDGCPDRGRVVVTDAAIEILDNLYFTRDSDVVRKEGMPIVDAIAATLQGNPTISKIEVQGHAAANERDPIGISDRRATAVRDTLIQRGIAGSRLVATGYGATQRIDQRATEEGHAKNRRVSFLIVKRDEPRPVSRDTALKPLDSETVASSARPTIKPVEVAGAVRYELAVPITIKRGSSTMISILNKSITAEDTYLWRPDANAPGSERHPFRVARVVNGSGYTLQPGSIAIFAGGTFVGDGLLERLDLDETAWVPYALDSSTAVTVERRNDEKPQRVVAVQRGTMVVENAGIRLSTYKIAVGRQPPRRIFIRHGKSRGFTASNLPPGTIDQGEALLVPLPISPGKTSELVIEEREPRRRSFQLLDSRDPELATYLTNTSELAPDVAAKLKAAIALRAELTAVEDRTAEARQQLTDIVQRAQEIRDSLRALDRVANADDLRKKLVVDLRETTTKSDGLTKQIETANQSAAALRAKLADAVRELALDPKKP